MGETISQLTQVQPSSALLIPAVDMSAPVGEKNVALALGTIFGGGRLFVVSGTPTVAANPGDLAVNQAGVPGSRLFIFTAAGGWLGVV
ncbi:MAG: hypothetical protein B7Z57_11590 [Acidiphilium sp. 37-60-79]|nr:MAG: hypothetical protein B7Z57_11590 [Acidiphilium sp. 37-60-79]OZB40856.1 MAG: hypothetical protein B7X48_03255 [Acidiphilium sp. 34-60-192]